MKIETIMLGLLRKPDQVDIAELKSLISDDWTTLGASATEHRCGPYLADALCFERTAQF